MKFIGRLKLLRGRQFRRNVVHLSSTNIAAQAIGLGALPLLSRIYDPAAFGSLAVYVSIYSLLLSFSALRLDWMIPRARSRRAAVQLQRAGILSVVLISMGSLLVVVCAVAADYRMLQFGMEWIPVSILFGGLFLLVQAEKVWDGAMLRVGLARLAQALMIVGVSISIGFLSGSGDGLIVGYAVGLLGALLVVWRELRSGGACNVDLAFIALLGVVRRRSREMLSQVGLAGMNILLTSSPVLLLAALFSEDEVGAYSVAFRVAVAPVAVITGAISYSFISEVSRLLRTEPSKIAVFYRRTVRRLLFLSAFAVIAAAAGSFVLPGLLGGGEWVQAGKYLLAVAPYLVGVIVFSPTTHLFLYGRAGWQTILDGVTLLAVLGSFVLCKMLWGSPIIAVTAASVLFLFGYLARHKAHLIAISKLEARTEYA